MVVGQGQVTNWFCAHLVDHKMFFPFYIEWSIFMHLMSRPISLLKLTYWLQQGYTDTSKFITYIPPAVIEEPIGCQPYRTKLSVMHVTMEVKTKLPWKCNFSSFPVLHVGMGVYVCVFMYASNWYFRSVIKPIIIVWCFYTYCVSLFSGITISVRGGWQSKKCQYDRNGNIIRRV